MNEHGKAAGLVLHSGPFSGRSSRDQLDVALAAASMGMDLELFFSGPGIVQLLEERDPGAAGLPAGIKGWKALPELCEVKAWTTAETLRCHVPHNAKLLLDVVESCRNVRRCSCPATA
jgi:sulfur relay (sulfurtransferase) DsrF/TusC family protein